MRDKKNQKNKVYNISDVDKLNLAVFILKKELEKGVSIKINELGGRVCSSMRAQGGFSVSRLFEVFSNIKSEYVVTFSLARAEDVANIIEAVAVEFNLDVEGNGKAFAVDIDGYLGAKGPFLK